LEIVDRRIRGEDLDREEKDAAIQAARDGRPGNGSTVAPGAGVMVIPVHGLIMHRARMVQDVSGPGGTSTEGLAKQFNAALRNPDVSAVVFDVDSGGGSAHGVEEAAAEIFKARGGEKPVVAVVNAMAGSAAYWLASQADEVVITPSGEAGSVGVFMAHEDYSEALAAEGIKVTFIHSGRYKVEGNMVEPLSDESVDYYQGQVDAVYETFVRDVARGRGVKAADSESPSTIRVSDGAIRPSSQIRAVAK
jgi:signal peptide peptidase SppA